MKKSPQIRNVHELHIYEWCPFQLCIDMHVVIFNDRNDINEAALVKEILKDIKQYFKSNHYVHEITIQPEIVTVI